MVNTIDYHDSEAFIAAISLQQVRLCLNEGQIVNGPRLDEHGNFVCVVYRLCGEHPVYVTFAIEPHGENRVFVLKVDNRWR